jgi:hypothetical protein
VGPPRPRGDQRVLVMMIRLRLVAGRGRDSPAPLCSGCASSLPLRLPSLQASMTDAPASVAAPSNGSNGTPQKERKTFAARNLNSALQAVASKQEQQQRGGFHTLACHCRRALDTHRTLRHVDTGSCPAVACTAKAVTNRAPHHQITDGLSHGCMGPTKLYRPASGVCVQPPLATSPRASPSSARQGPRQR